MISMTSGVTFEGALGPRLAGTTAAMPLRSKRDTSRPTVLR